MGRVETALVVDRFPYSPGGERYDATCMETVSVVVRLEMSYEGGVDIRGSHQEQDHETESRLDSNIGLKVQLERNSSDIQIKHRVHDVVGDQSSCEHVGLLARITPALGVGSEKIPSVRDDGAGEEREDEEGHAPDGD